MSENPYQSSSDGAVARWFRPWRVAFVVVIFLAVIIGAVGWQAAREKVARERAAGNLQRIRQALEQYESRQLAPSPGPPPHPAD
ncbi:MAG TPA: hypothetical protein VFI31_15380 [Pirellulales bacterium]|nr:hypothetical protein [Pirellulales bacterium]